MLKRYSSAETPNLQRAKAQETRILAHARDQCCLFHRSVVVV